MGAKASNVGTTLKDIKLLLTNELIEDLTYGAQQIHTSIKEKYLGRLPGMKRGDVKVDYASNALKIVVSGIMITILIYVQF